MQDDQVRRDILETAIMLFNENGLKFTMDALAGQLHKSKKTIYQYFPDKRHLLDGMVDYVFDEIRDCKRKAASDHTQDTVERLRCVLGAMPEQYAKIDVRKLYVLKDKYPKIYAHVQTRLENGWEETIALLVEGMNEGVLRDVPIPVFKTMFEATLEQFFQQDVLVENGISYRKALQEVIDILMDGIVARKDA